MTIPNHAVLLAGLAFATLLAAGCKSVDCGDGTTEKNGVCVASDDTVGNAQCGPFTQLQGDKCVPMFPPTMCDPQTTMTDVDPTTGVTTCIGTGGGGCSAAFACPMPTDSTKQTVCGQIYDFQSNVPFAATGATGAKCMGTETTGPCSLAINAFDAVKFATDPTTAPRLPTGELFIDDCGRYRVPDIDITGVTFIGLGTDDADAGAMGPMGTTNTVGIAVSARANTATRDVEDFVVPKATTDAWVSSGGPPVDNGLFATVFYGHSTGRDLTPGVTVVRQGATIPANDSYFVAAETTRTTIDPAASATGADGTGLVINASLADGTFAYAGQGGGLPAECKWEPHGGASLPFIVFVQIFRPVNATLTTTCPL